MAGYLRVELSVFDHYISPMDGYGPATYGDRIAGVYDVWPSSRTSAETEQTVGFLRRYAGARALELGIGTGRVALALAQALPDVVVDGIEASARMIDRLRAKSGSDRLRVFRGDFAEVDVPGVYDLIFATSGTFFHLTSVEHQARCLRNSAARLSGAGRLVLELPIPDFDALTAANSLQVRQIGLDFVHLFAARYDPDTRRHVSQHIVLRDGGVDLMPAVMCPVTADEIDLMAADAGLALEERAGGWVGEPFDPVGYRYVSVYRSTRRRSEVSA